MWNDDAGRLVLKAFSVLLRYPEENWIRALPDIEKALDSILPKSSAGPLNQFFSWAKGLAPLRLQESYTAAFDLNPATCLDLTYHSQGDTENRGRVLSRLRAAYRAADCEYATAELPDHLPLVLEFLSFAEEGKDAVLALCAPAAQTLAENLAANESPYAGLVVLASDILTEMAADAEQEVMT